MCHVYSFNSERKGRGQGEGQGREGTGEGGGRGREGEWLVAGGGYCWGVVGFTS